ncbi:MAG: glycosyltransferase family 39 protein [Acidobacteria bacterium]|nr:glycosyltransferase family 39 protein [Acidobacteriota bacterium]
MPMNNRPIPKWIHWLVLLVILGQLGALGLMLAGRLHGPQRNLVPQALLGGAMALFVLAGFVLRNHGESLRPAPARIGIVALTVLAFALCGLYFVRNRAILTLPYDLGGWSESYFLTDIIKWNTGTPLYTAPDDSNSGTYTPGAAAISHFLASLMGKAQSVRTYRFLLQLYLAIAALFAGAAAWNLLRLSDPERFSRYSRWWLPFFVLASFLIATNPETNAFNIFLHNDPLSVLAATIGFWVLTKFALSQNPRWLVMMAVLPALAYLAKQFLALFAAIYVVYLWLDGKSSLRRVITFGAITFAILAATILGGLLIWGDAYRYWVFEVMGSHTVSFIKLNERFADAAWNILLGLLGGLVLLRGERSSRLLPLWVGWLMMTLGGMYTSGITYLPTHLGPASMVGGCFALAALAMLWPSSDEADARPALQWLQVAVGCLAVLSVFAGMGFTHSGRLPLDADLQRYVRAIEHEFNGVPADRVLLDMGEWVYLRENVLAKDRMAILNTHRTPHYGLLDRIRNHAYDRILVHVLSDGAYSYELGGERDIQKELLAYYRPVRRIAGIKNMDRWLFYDMAMSEIVVLEPIPPPQSEPANPASDASQKR